MSKLSIVILTRNSEQTLELCLKSADFADEIILIDDNSTDKTESIAKKFKTKIYKNVLNQDFSQARNLGLNKATNEWVLFLDSDEIISKELKNEIKKVIETSEYDGYLIKRQDQFLEKILKHGETQHINLIRLGRKQSGKWQGKVHETWFINGEVGQLDNPLFHRSHKNLENFFDKLNFYSEIEAKKRFEENVPISFWQILMFPLAKFFYNYIFLKGYADGWRGFVMAYFMSLHSLFVRIKHYEKFYLKNKTQINIDISTYSKIEKLHILGICVSIALGQMIRLEITKASAIYLFDVLIAVYLFLFGLSQLRYFDHNILNKLNLGQKLSLYFGGGFLIWLCCSWVFNLPLLGLNDSLQGLLYLIRFLVYSLFGVSLLVGKSNSKGAINQGINWIFGISLLLGLGQFIFFPDTRILLKLGWDDHLNRLVFPWFDPGFTGLIFGIGFFYYLLTKKFNIFALSIFLSAIMLTYSRASILALIGGLILILFLEKKSRYFSIISIALVFLMFSLLPVTLGEGVDLNRTSTIESRIESTQKGINIFSKNPIMGLGFNNYSKVSQINESRIPYHPSSPDNSFIFIMTVSGIVGLSLFVLTLASIFFESLKDKKIITVLIAIISFHSLFNNSWFYPFVYLIFWLIWADSNFTQKKKL